MKREEEEIEEAFIKCLDQDNLSIYSIEPCEGHIYCLVGTGEERKVKEPTSLAGCAQVPHQTAHCIRAEKISRARWLWLMNLQKFRKNTEGACILGI